MGATVNICTTCEGGRALCDALDAEAGVRGVPCMNVCSRPATVAIRAPGKEAYLFGDVSVDLAEEVQAFLRLYRQSGDGIITDARALPRLRHLLIGRIPA